MGAIFPDTFGEEITTVPSCRRDNGFADKLANPRRRQAQQDSEFLPANGQGLQVNILSHPATLMHSPQNTSWFREL